VPPGLSAGAAARHCGQGPPVSPQAPLCARHGAARSRQSGVIAGCPKPPAVTTRPPLLPSPSFTWCTHADPSFSFHHGATPSLSPSYGLQGVGHHPVPLLSELEHRHPPFSTSQARVTGLGHQTPCHPAGFGAAIATTLASR
jgi:hypothetical protein